ncbi:restriction endonuclease subunit S [Chryseobacterium geocarposphaerae]|uniref:Type I restriction enzyme S subunit n=1 Tax=Chryseobacterium geocarposphaerae TaxID=1416776 RepID=A0A2M9C8F3_9FLAO|nr:type I restriction enzyme S subunit [Chryseobacterium geocarposphaerae]
MPILAITQDYGAIPRDLIDFKITVTDKSVESYKVVEVGDFIISLRSFQGGIEYSEYRGICSPAYIILRPNISIDRIFFKYYLKTPKYIIHLNRKLEGIRDGKMISYSYFSDIILPLPSIDEQNKVSAFLSLIESRIATQKKIIEDLQITKKEISFKLFKGGFNSSELRKENFQKLGDLTYIVNKKNKENLKLPVYSINNKKGFISQSEQFEGIDSDERGYDISLYKIIEKETFAYNPARINVGSIGYSGNLENIIISSLYVCFKTVDVVDDKFLFHYLRTDIFRKEVLRNVEGGVRDYLFYESFSRIKINLPDLKEQIKIAHFLSKFDEKINLESDLLALYENQKKYLLHNLFV